MRCTALLRRVTNWQVITRPGLWEGVPQHLRQRAMSTQAKEGGVLAGVKVKRQQSATLGGGSEGSASVLGRRAGVSQTRDGQRLRRMHTCMHSSLVSCSESFLLSFFLSVFLSLFLSFFPSLSLCIYLYTHYICIRMNLKLLFQALETEVVRIVNRQRNNTLRRIDFPGRQEQLFKGDQCSWTKSETQLSFLKP